MYCTHTCTYSTCTQCVSVYCTYTCTYCTYVYTITQCVCMYSTHTCTYCTYTQSHSVCVCTIHTHVHTVHIHSHTVCVYDTHSKNYTYTGSGGGVTRRSCPARGQIGCDTEKDESKSAGPRFEILQGIPGTWGSIVLINIHLLLSIQLVSPYQCLVSKLDVFFPLHVHLFHAHSFLC